MSDSQPSLFTESGAPNVVKPTVWDRHVQPAIDRVDANADPDWRDVALECVRELAATKLEFSADDFVEAMELKEVTTHQPSASGPMFLRAKKRGWITQAGYTVQSRIGRRHRQITVWESLIFGGTP
ncbi:MAG: hypothetical protein AAFU85_30680 [Planctomycetota bacterium]